MKPLEYLKHPVHGCCTIPELLALGKEDKGAVETLKEYARQEMRNKGIEVEES